MAQKEAAAADVTIDLLTIQSNALEAIRDYRRYRRRETPEASVTSAA